MDLYCLSVSAGDCAEILISGGAEATSIIIITRFMFCLMCGSVTVFAEDILESATDVLCDP